MVNGGKAMNIADDLVKAYNEGYQQGKKDAVVRGEWVEKPNPNWQAYSHEHCSICGWENGIQAKKYRGLNYCPNCGAKMEDKP